MRLLLLKDVRKLGHVGDIVDVKAGYARNYLLPQLLATDPTEENIKAIEEERKRATSERARRQTEFLELAEKLGDASVTIEATANPEGTLYGSVGSEEIAAALQAQGFAVLPKHVQLDSPIRTLDNLVVNLEFTDEITAQVKVWVVREGAGEHVDESAEPSDDGETYAEDESEEE
ncbi:MAG: 50S ribosomal protein L9 [Planctomycetes bacterium]|nr:50S ribosomal protein L9 [Planctomycetota bacterium]